MAGEMDHLTISVLYRKGVTDSSYIISKFSLIFLLLL